jgi:HK97 family phage prohead protease
MEADFSGYATKAGLKCTDGRTIMPDAFKHNDGAQVPLVWQHGHTDPNNVLGHAKLENRSDGVYAYCFLNDTPSGQNAGKLVKHGDINALSIYANKLIEKGQAVFHGSIKEVSLVLSGANPGALIDNVNIAHSDGDIEILDDEAIIYTGLTLEHSDEDADEDLEHADEPTVQDIYDSMTEDQKQVLHFMVGAALQADAGDIQQSDESEDVLTHQEGTDMTRNVFDQNGAKTNADGRPHLTHDQLQSIVEDAKKRGSFKEAFLAHAVTYGIENIDYLFPDAKNVMDSPEFISRRMEWVTGVINGARKSPFSRIKSMSADITHDEARAKGYVKATMKKEEFFALSKRITTPTTIYKKQKLDRDDIIDITDLDVVAWLKAEMRVMLDEEIARAVLIGDGREIDDEDKIIETYIRPIAHDDDFYAHKVVIPANTTGDALVEAIVRARPAYRGTGNPTMYCTEGMLTDLLLVKDKMGRRLYPTQSELASALRVSNIVTVPVMEDQSTDGGDLLAILVNMSDYTLGADKGGAISFFDDFDIDYNQYKYLYETRLSGALTKYKTALVFSRAAGTMTTPMIPTFVPATGIVTIPATSTTDYTQDGVSVASGPQSPIPAGATTEVVATPKAGYYFQHNTDTDWEFTRDS